MRGRVRICLHGLALLSGLLLAGRAGVAEAQYNRTVPAAAPNWPSVHRGMYSAGPIGGIQQYNPAWQSDGQARMDNGNLAYPPMGIAIYTPEMASKPSYGSLATPRYGYSYGYGSKGGWWNGNGSNGVGGIASNRGAWNTGGWNGSGWDNNGRNVGYWNGGPRNFGNGFSGVTFGTVYGVANYDPYFNQASTVSIPALPAFRATSTSADASVFGW